jgi:hypothetical protein
MRNEQTLLALCDALTANCGDMLRASKQAGVSLLFIQQWRKDDDEVDKRILNAAELGTQTLVSAAITRGVYGIDRDVYYKGDVVGQQKEYSDTLLQTLLKAKVKEFARDGEQSAPQVTVNIANLMPRATTYEEWLTMKAQTLTPLPAPTEQPMDVEYAEYVPVSAFDGIEL